MTPLAQIISDIQSNPGMPDYVDSVVKKIKKRYERSKLIELKNTLAGDKQLMFQQSMTMLQLSLRIITLEGMISDLESKTRGVKP